MLRFTEIQDAGAAGSYYGKTDGGYYLDGPELHREGAARARRFLDSSTSPTSSNSSGC